MKEAIYLLKRKVANDTWEIVRVNTDKSVLETLKDNLISEDGAIKKHLKITTYKDTTPLVVYKCIIIPSKLHKDVVNRVRTSICIESLFRDDLRDNDITIRVKKGITTIYVTSLTRTNAVNKAIKTYQNHNLIKT